MQFAISVQPDTASRLSVFIIETLEIHNAQRPVQVTGFDG
jgi:hypothetical protein